MRNLSAKYRSGSQATGAIIWSPKSFPRANEGFDVEEHRLSEEKLVQFGLLASRLRRQVYEKSDLIRASNAVEELDDAQAGDVDGIKLKRSYTRKRDMPGPPADEESFKSCLVPGRRKTKSGCHTTSQEVLDMLAEVKATRMSQKDAAIKYNCKEALVSRMVCAQRRNPDFLQKRQQKEQEKATKTEMVLRESESLLSEKKDIWTS